jgi:cell division septation protein DedD
LRAAKLLALTSTFLLTAACSTFSGETADKGPSGDAYSNPRAIEMQTKLARLQTENARLANRVLELQRENESLKRASKDAAAEESEQVEEETLTAPQDTAVALRDPQSETAPKPVVDNPEAPEMAKSEVPVESAPRLTQPTFASTDAVFENEAETVATAPMAALYGVHLASYRKAREARDGWRKLQRENPDELGLLEPRVDAVDVPEKGLFLRLIGGGLSSREKAEALCSNLKTKGLFCSVSEFSGERLSLTETGG